MKKAKCDDVVRYDIKDEHNRTYKLFTKGLSPFKMAYLVGPFKNNYITRTEASILLRQMRRLGHSQI